MVVYFRVLSVYKIDNRLAVTVTGKKISGDRWQTCSVLFCPICKIFFSSVVSLPHILIVLTNLKNHLCVIISSDIFSHPNFSLFLYLLEDGDDMYTTNAEFSEAIVIEGNLIYELPSFIPFEVRSKCMLFLKRYLQKTFALKYNYFEPRGKGIVRKWLTNYYLRMYWMRIMDMWRTIRSISKSI